jgi:hypothetical protein
MFGHSVSRSRYAGVSGSWTTGGGAQPWPEAPDRGPQASQQQALAGWQPPRRQSHAQDGHDHHGHGPAPSSSMSVQPRASAPASDHFPSVGAPWLHPQAHLPSFQSGFGRALNRATSGAHSNQPARADASQSRNQGSQQRSEHPAPSGSMSPPPPHTSSVGPSTPSCPELTSRARSLLNIRLSAYKRDPSTFTRQSRMRLAIDAAKVGVMSEKQCEEIRAGVELSKSEKDGSKSGHPPSSDNAGR